MRNRNRMLSRAAVRCRFESLERRTLLSAVGAVREAPSQLEEIHLPRSLTAEEIEWLKHNTMDATSLVPSAPPTGTIKPVAEYEPMEALVISWMGSSSWLNILAQITRRVTVEGDGRMYIGVTGSGSSTQASATSTLNSFGANLNNVTFFTVPLNAIWVRDYGPRYVYEGDVRIITDHLYNRPLRPLDNNQPVVFGQFKQHQYYEMGINGTTLIHGGGNYHLNAFGDAYATNLIAAENPSLTQSQIRQIYADYQNNDLTITAAFPTSVDATQHIDMWMQIFDDNKAFISNWPNAPGSTQAQICDSVASLMESRGYTVTRIPAYNFSGVHYTYTNMVIFNDVVLLPQYNNGPGATVSNQVLATVQAAFGPGKTVYQINADGIITAAGAFHCIVQHIPAHRGLPGANGGLAPTAYLRGPNGGESFLPGEQYQIKWITDDDAPVASSAGVQSVSILLSTDGGQTFNTTIATSQSALGTYLWTIPSGIHTTDARIRVVAQDALGNSGFDDSDAGFTITDPAIPAVAGSQFVFESAPHQLAFAFSQDVSSSLGTDDILLENLTTSQTIPAADLALSYDAGTNTATFTYVGSGSILPDGNYRATLVAAGITNPGGNPLPQDHVYMFFFLNGDANRDGTVNLDDFNILASNFGQAGRNFSQGNFNYDVAGLVNLDDFNILASKFGVMLAGGSLSSRPSPFGSSEITDGEKDETADLLA